jgi:hypothetical protein
MSIFISLAGEKWSQIVLVKGGERRCVLSSLKLSIFFISKNKGWFRPESYQQRCVGDAN